MRLVRRDIPHATEVLASAFRDDPLLVYASPDPMHRERLAQRFCRVSLCYALRYGEVYAPEEDVPGVAAWLPSTHFPLTPAKVLRAVPWSTLLSLGRAGGARLRVVDAHLQELHARVAPFPHQFLFVLGVAPERQGQGYASRLLRPILHRLNEERIPCYLDTLAERNIPLYEHFGFRVVEASSIPGTPLRAWALLREPFAAPGLPGRRARFSRR